MDAKVGEFARIEGLADGLEEAELGELSIGDGEFGGVTTIAMGDLGQGLREGDVLGEQRLIELRVRATMIVGGQGGGPFLGDLAAEQAFLHRAVGDDADVVLFAVRQEFGFG